MIAKRQRSGSSRRPRRAALRVALASLAGLAGLASLAGLAACEGVAPPVRVAPAPLPPAPASPPASASASASASAPPAASAPDALVSAVIPDAPLAGCSSADEAATKAELRALGARIRSATQESTAPALYADLAAAWRRPCLVHVARIAPPPASGGLTALRRAWDAGLGGTLVDSAGGLVDRAGRVFAVPPEVPRALDDDAKRALAPLACDDGAPSCARARSYVLRAEAAFAATVARDEKRAPPTEPDRCARAIDAWPEGVDRPTPFEAWSSCVAQSAPRAWIYADVPLRAPERGWLVLRGRRGHYQFSDEVRAYDLATGAAYVVKSLPLYWVKWLVAAVVVFTAVALLRAAAREETAPAS